MAKKVKNGNDKKPSLQPSSLETTIEKPELFKAGMLMELQQLTDTRKHRQLSISEMREAGNEVEIHGGLDALSIPQMRAISAIQILLDKTNYKGNEPDQNVKSDRYKWAGTIPALSFRYSKFYEAYGLEKNTKGKYNRSQQQEALEALEALTESRNITYSRRNQNGKYDAIVTKGPLIQLTKAYKNLSQDELEMVRAGQTPKGKRAIGLMVNVSPLFVDQLETFYTLKPVKLYQELKALAAQEFGRTKGKMPEAYLKLIMYLNILDNKAAWPVHRIGREKLGRKLGLGVLYDTRQKKRAQKQIDEAIKLALAGGWLLESKENSYQDGYVFKLNPERCNRLKIMLEPPKKEAEN